MLIGMGWLTCVPFDTDVLTGEPIVQCNSISDQTPCPAGVVEYPGQGYCPSTDNGYVPELFEQMLGLRGLGVPYWDLPAANKIGYWSLPGGLMPIERVARDNNMPAPSEATIQAVQAERMRQITNGAIQNYMGADLREDRPYFPPSPVGPPPPMAVQVVRTPSGRPGQQISQAIRDYHAGRTRSLHGLGDVLCPDGTNQPTLTDCLSHGYVDPSTVCPNGFQLDSSGAVCVPSPAPASSSSSSSTAQQITTAIQTALQNGGCPTGYVMLAAGGVCIPANSPAAIAQSKPATKDWTKYAMIGGGVLLAVVVLAMVAKR